MYISELYDSGYDLRFLYWVMEHIDFTRYQDAGDLKKITQKPFMQMKYIKPPISIQRAYNAFVAFLMYVEKNMENNDELHRGIPEGLIEAEIAKRTK